MKLADWTQMEDRLFRAERAALFACVLLVCYLAFLASGWFHRLWLVDESGQGIAVDFVATWAAGHMALAGRAAEAYDLTTFIQEQLLVVARYDGNYSWAYPPFYFLLAAPLALFSYPVAAVVWIAATFLGYLAAIRAISPGWAVVIAAASPFALWNAFEGQNGFLTAALIGGILALLDRRPVAAGILLGLLTLKPQLGVLFPLVLALTGRWRAFAAATLTAAAMALVSLAVFGAATWQAFFAAIQAQGDAVLARGSVPFSKQQSVHALVRLLGGGEGLAWGLHIAAALAAAAFVCWLWLRPADYRLKAAALATAALIATPYLFLYDLPILSVPVVFLMSAGATYGYVPGERTLLAFLMVGLLLVSGIPVGVPLLALLMLLVAARYARSIERGRSPVDRIEQAVGA